MNAIMWPDNFTPGFTDNFCSNEVIVAGLSSVDIWPLLVAPAQWPTYYENSANSRIYEDGAEDLALGYRFYFETFGFPVEAKCVELVTPTLNQPGRIAWHGWAGEDASRLDVHHAWLIEDLPQNRVRILTQETQIGEPAKALATTKPNPMINGHQDWLDGLVVAAQKLKQSTIK